MLYGAVYLPEPVYRSLPWIYVIVGTVVMLSMGGFIGFVSGLLLTTAGMLVFLWRASARVSLERASRLHSPVRASRRDRG